jgi:hypothetical protein
MDYANKLYIYVYIIYNKYNIIYIIIGKIEQENFNLNTTIPGGEECGISAEASNYVTFLDTI